VPQAGGTRSALGRARPTPRRPGPTWPHSSLGTAAAMPTRMRQSSTISRTAGRRSSVEAGGHEEGPRRMPEAGYQRA
jgi:hypothetical protein